jgi:hypothetical protein
MDLPVSIISGVLELGDLATARAQKTRQAEYQDSLTSKCKMQEDNAKQEHAAAKKRAKTWQKQVIRSAFLFEMK